MTLSSRTIHLEECNDSEYVQIPNLPLSAPSSRSTSATRQSSESTRERPTDFEKIRSRLGGRDIGGLNLFTSLDYWLLTLVGFCLTGTGLMWINSVGTVVCEFKVKRKSIFCMLANALICSDIGRDTWQIGRGDKTAIQADGVLFFVQVSETHQRSGTSIQEKCSCLGRLGIGIASDRALTLVEVDILSLRRTLTLDHSIKCGPCGGFLSFQ